MITEPSTNVKVYRKERKKRKGTKEQETMMYPPLQNIVLFLLDRALDA
jgi:hypothetical protein